MLSHALWSFLFCLYAVIALPVRDSIEESPFSCTGGSIYFIAHPVDGLLYQNPDLLHDIYVFKCVTTIVLTSGGCSMDANVSLSLERGLQDAHVLMAGLSVDNSAREEAIIQVGTHSLRHWSLRGMPNIQIMYLRLPDGLPSGRGHDANGGESLSKLYRKEIETLTSTDGNTTYTHQELKELIAFILHARKPNDVGILNHKAAIPQGNSINAPSDHADHIVSAKLVMDVITEEKINSTVKSYAGNIMRKFKANINTSHDDFARKSAAFFKYAAYDEHMCQNLEQCSDAFMDEKLLDADVRYAVEYFGREYYVL